MDGFGNMHGFQPKRHKNEICRATVECGSEQRAQASHGLQVGFQRSFWGQHTVSRKMCNVQLPIVFLSLARVVSWFWGRHMWVETGQFHTNGNSRTARTSLGGSVDEALTEICALVRELSKAARVAVSCRDIKKQLIRIVARSTGLPRSIPLRYAIPLVGPQQQTIKIKNVLENPAFDGHPVFEEFPQLRSVAAYWIGSAESVDYTLVVINPSPAFFLSASIDNSMQHVILALRAMLLPNTERPVPNSIQATQPASARAEKPNIEPTMNFLLNSLVVKQRLLARNGSTYMALRQWRRPIKEFQLEALTSIKAAFSEQHVDVIAEEVRAAVETTYGKAFKQIVPVPAGSSGRDVNFATAIARALARKMKIPCNELLIAEGVKLGRSHPMKSAVLKPYGLREEPNGNTLIIDDVATSGRHIELAASAIRPYVDLCTSIVWIAD